MNLTRRAPLKVSTPAMVVLATVVNAAAVTEPLARPEKSMPDLAWAVRGEAASSAESSKAFFAKKAVRTIDSIDQISGAAPLAVRACWAEQLPPHAPPAVSFEAQRPCRSSHQHSAP